MWLRGSGEVAAAPVVVAVGLSTLWAQCRKKPHENS